MFRTFLNAILLCGFVLLDTLAAQNAPVISAPYRQESTPLHSRYESELTYLIDTQSDGNAVFTLCDDFNNTTSQTSFIIAKYDNRAERLWRETYIPEHYTYIYALALGKDGSLYVTGETNVNLTEEANNDGSTYDLFVRRIDPADGSILWTRQFDDNATSEYPTAIAVDNDGRVYVTGSSYSSALQGTFLMQLDPGDGSQNWKRFYSAPENIYGPTYIEAGRRAIAFDSLGAVYTAGYTDYTADLDANPDTNGSIYIMKHLDDGTLLWVTQTGSIDDIQPLLAVSGDDRPYLVTLPYYFEMMYTHPAISTFDSDLGSQLWSRDISIEGDFFPERLQSAPDGGLYLLGSYVGEGDADGDPLTVGTTLLAAFHSDGIEAWKSQVDLSGMELYTDGYSLGVSVDSNNTLHLFGQTSDGSDQSFAIADLTRHIRIKHPAGSLAVTDIDAHDADGDPVTFGFAEGENPFMSIDSLTGEVRFFEPPEYHEGNIFWLDVTATDASGLSDTVPMTVEIVPEPVPAVLSPSLLMYLLN